MESVVRELLRTIDARDWDRLPEFFDPDIVYERPGYPPFEGLQRVLQFYRTERVISCGAHELGLVVSDGAHAACWGRFVGTHRDGSTISEEFADVYIMAGNRIKFRKSFFFRPAI
jgi:ketosteroid isomerase-like protein